MNTYTIRKDGAIVVTGPWDYVTDWMAEGQIGTYTLTIDEDDDDDHYATSEEE